MIQKVLKIKGVGKFVDFACGGDTQFRKTNIIYGENSKGKTTLTSIIRSLKDEENCIIPAKKTIGSTEMQEIEILVEGDSHPIKYTDNKWTKLIPNIEVFDSHFINTNVYSGMTIDSDHKKHLHNFVLGAQGVLLSNEISEIKRKIEESNVKVRLSKSQIQGLVEGLYSIDDYVKLTRAASLEKEAEEIKKKIEIVKANKTIQEQENIEAVRPFELGVDINRIGNVLQKTISSIQTTYIQKVDSHKKHLAFSSAEEWIQQGLTAIKDDKCPFCTQQLSNSKEIILAYTQFFNTEYRTLQEEASLVLKEIKRINVEVVFASIEFLRVKNKGKGEFWKTYIKDEYVNPNLERIIESKAKIIAQINKVITLIEQKNTNLLDSVDKSACGELELLIKDVNDNIAEHNDIVEKYNEKIQALKSKPQDDLPQLQTQLKKIEIAMNRFESQTDKLCADYLADLKLLDGYNKQKDEKQKSLNEFTKQVFEKYEKSINEYLLKFGVDFKIKEAKGGNYRGMAKDPYAEYAIMISECKLNFDDDGVHPCVKNTLGEGDKAALAFAFFLAKLEIDGHLETKIVVFDDPLSSFDENRKNATLDELHKLSKQVKQLIVLTHNSLIAREFWLGLKDTDTCRTLRIIRKGQTSCISEYDIDKETASPYFQNYKTLDKYIQQGGDSPEVKLAVGKCIRPLLEGYLRIKFPGAFHSKQWLGEMITAIRDASATSVLSKIQNRLSQLEGLNSYSKKFHHETNPNLHNQTINESELTTYAKQSLDFIYQ